MRRTARWMACALLSGAAACGGNADVRPERGAPPAAAGEGTRFRTTSLPSGRKVTVMGVEPMRFAEGSPSIMFKYETDIPLDSMRALTAEAEEIFASIKADAERDGFGGVIVSANTPPSGGVVSRASGYNFVFQRAMNGVWRRLES